MSVADSTASVDGRIAIVTGASAGIGRALARDLARGGARLVVNARREEPLQQLREEFGSDRVAVVAGDAADAGLITELLDRARETFGADADLVAINAGRGLRGSVFDSDTGQWEEMLRTNILGASLLMRAAAERMVAMLPDVSAEPGAFEDAWAKVVADGRPCRDIVVLGSTVGRHISPFSSMYGASKFAVNSLAEALRRQLAGSGVRVTLIEPGVVRTEFQESAGYEMDGFGAFMERVGPVLTAEDVSRSILFTVSQPPAIHVNDVMIRPTRQEYP
ncbi:MAG: SDR family oxidoreductase [Planctomycetota bacterium]